MINKSSDADFEKSEFDNKKLGITLSVLSFIISSIVIFYILAIHLDDVSVVARGGWLIPSMNYKFYFLGVVVVFLYSELFFFKKRGLAGLIKALPIVMLVVATSLVVSVMPRELIFRIPIIAYVPEGMPDSALQYERFLLSNDDELVKWVNENEANDACQGVSSNECMMLFRIKVVESFSNDLHNAKSLAVLGMNIVMASIAFVLLQFFHGFLSSDKARNSRFNLIRMFASYWSGPIEVEGSVQ